MVTRRQQKRGYRNKRHTDYEYFVRAIQLCVILPKIQIPYLKKIANKQMMSTTKKFELGTFVPTVQRFKQNEKHVPK
jgi:hypothetical protein